MILLDKVATKVHLTYDDGGENHKERVLVYIRVGTVDSLVLYSYYYFIIIIFMNFIFAVWNIYKYSNQKRPDTFALWFSCCFQNLLSKKSNLWSQKSIIQRARKVYPFILLLMYLGNFKIWINNTLLYFFVVWWCSLVYFGYSGTIGADFSRSSRSLMFNTLSEAVNGISATQLYPHKCVY